VLLCIDRHLLGKQLGASLYTFFPKSLPCLAAEKWDLQKAIARTELNLVWRRSMNIYDIQGMAKSLEQEVS
jgi:hypothetical protein